MEERDIFFNESHDLICIASMDGYFKQVNPQFEKTLGFTREELLSRPLIDFIHPDDHEATFVEIDKQIKGLTTKNFENRYFCKDGSIKILSWMAVPVMEDARIYAVARDVTEHKAMELELRLQGEIITNMAEGVILVNAVDNRIVYANPKMRQMFDCEDMECTDICLSTLIAPSHITVHEIGESLQNGGVWKGELLCTKKTGVHFWIYATISTFEHNKYGTVWIAIFKDVTERKQAAADLDKFFNLSLDMLCIADVDGYFRRINPMFEKTLGFTAEELMSRPFIEFVHPDDRQKTLNEMVKLSQGLNVINFENRYICKDGTYKDLVWISSPEAGFYYATARDITEKKKIEEEIRIERDKLISIMETIDDGIYITGQNCELQYINPVVEREFGAVTGRLCYEYFYNKSEPCPWCRKEEVFSGKTIYWEWHYPANNKTYHRYDTPIKNRDGSVSKFALFHDITELKKSEMLITASLKEKEMLVGEIHHRVKNNLAIISSLLRMQSYSIKDINSLRIFKETENRIKSISSVHEMLYRTNDMTSVDFREYIDKLIKTIYSTYRGNLSGIKLITDVSDVSLGIDLAIPCGLLINELLTNAAKYAFPAGGDGEIHIGLHCASNGIIELTVKDDGVGIPETLDIWNTETLGCQLITGITKTQLRGELELKRDNGTEIIVRFKARGHTSG
ncbi:PAS domain S-box protein [Candidatus Magnetominusculus xianensis]|uniref:Signal transduction histidine kinase n=1 Tax=Candidatus Magnetominusculus xianensis TaxID=1748249 RepID=A0ABR5SAZ1_9BACT|nr:PAS domain S-box protein [Candidatus Magnetominusculus xianensis]KWT75277.1 signal transduction histidine kinase [Candidatus Magnetominusculus xianensis]MBF0405611.1 PAS domain S-box protein [Nitrospirota bacterium]